MENQDTAREIAWLLKEKYAGVESDLSAEQAEAFQADCTRLAAGEPLGYVIGQVPFLDCQIWLDSHPLIPRPETEYWVEQAIKEILNTVSDSGLPRFARLPAQAGNDGAVRILDLCAGSGAIGVAVAKAVAEAHVTFAEIDEAHLPTIEKNLENNLLEYPNRLGYSSIIISDLFENVDGKFDFILTNPPYIDANANTIDKNVKENEPHLALFGGDKGMEVIGRIIAGARAKLAPHGQLWIEHEPFQIDAITKLAKEEGFTITTHNDQYNVPRYSILE
ncbi:MAG: HemK family protein methyltransferase [Candidatus Pacebacteria bacterium]|nr:HemK family protein methyltransferase [Candidatus Paceibacterota bacterium]